MSCTCPPSSAYAGRRYWEGGCRGRDALLRRRGEPPAGPPCPRTAPTPSPSMGASAAGRGRATSVSRWAWSAPPSRSIACPSHSLSAAELLQALWAPAWPCPALQLSDQSGALSASEMDDWLQDVQRNYSIFGQDLLRRWRNGFRVGNYQNLTGILLSPPTGPSSSPKPCCPSALPPTLGPPPLSSTRRPRCAPVLGRGGGGSVGGRRSCLANMVGAHDTS